MKNKDIKKGMIFLLKGDSKNLGITDYNCRIDTTCIIEDSPKKFAKKALVTIEYIDNDNKVLSYVYTNKLNQQII